MLVQSSKVYVVRIGGMFEAAFKDQGAAESYRDLLAEDLSCSVELLEGYESSVLVPCLCTPVGKGGVS